MDLKKFVIDVKDFPKKGILFKDITPLLNDVDAFKEVIDTCANFVRLNKGTVLVAPEARGFLFAPAVAYATGTKFVLVRKPGKLPREVNDVEYSLEYGTNHLQMQKGDLKNGDRVIILDDVLATGGTMDAIIQLCQMEPGVEIVGISCLIDITNLHDDKFEKKYNLQTVIKY